MEGQTLSGALAILTSMITPALLISACGTLILSTSNRLSRVTDRVRNLTMQMERLAEASAEVVLRDERRAMLFDQIRMLSSRARVLQRALTLLYLSVCAFVATSVALGLISASRVTTSSLPVSLGLVGVALLFGVSALLIYEGRLARASLRVELDFLLKLGEALAPEGASKRRRGRFRRKAAAIPDDSGV
jgi:hypothetical protein